MSAAPEVGALPSGRRGAGYIGGSSDKLAAQREKGAFLHLRFRRKHACVLFGVVCSSLERSELADISGFNLISSRPA